MKFENVKKGDVVFRRVAVRYGGRFGVEIGRFYIPFSVVHVTSKFFDIGKNKVRFRKDNGCEHGTEKYRTSESVYNPGEVPDQTEEYKDAISHAKKLDNATALARRCNFTNWPKEDVNKIVELFNKNKDGVK